jgi:hypothetical protein
MVPNDHVHLESIPIMASNISHQEQFLGSTESQRNHEIRSSGGNGHDSLVH